ncbi:RimJ/RimL family protein N-acetyltransferase [Prauserella shujinwangii]|uniref:RimJ/RimL family protein N-acetyltransferase n=1 Tax=Prauserella shujinwangii TaxID=1453103 RepID=A0A2T0LMN3_9PSEU|nr:GNAT family N-acetyltransferase [Prauserella shujinwangii]PRX44339.1 RimJ/RimL family protein N-acetyltransferase [Prauserella shujinwangii]
MDPVEINAGGYYLRQLRADDRMDDRPALVAAFADPEMRRFVTVSLGTLADAGDYVALRAAEWARGRRCSWAVAEPTTGDLLGEVGLKDLDPGAGTAEASVWVAPPARGRGVAVAAVEAALRFGFGGLGLREVRYRHHRDNRASATVAARCGFRHAGSADPADEVWLRTADQVP